MQTRRLLSDKGQAGPRLPGPSRPPRGAPRPPRVPPATGSPALSSPGSLGLLLLRKPEALETPAWVGGHPLGPCSWGPQGLGAAFLFHPWAVASSGFPGGLSWSASLGLTSEGLQGTQLRCTPFVKLELRVGGWGEAALGP